MANNVYIGNRYVPVFANPVEWDNLREYEPLTIVTYNGTAYTSKKTVPVGTALNDANYWVVTGNYNAQVELYRQEVVEAKQFVEDSIEEIKSELTVSVKDFGAKGDGTTDDTVAIQNAVNSLVTSGNRVLYFPTGRYKITNTINISGKDVITLIGDGDSTMFDNKSNKWTITLTNTNRVTIKNIRVLCNGTAKGINFTGVARQNQSWFEKITIDEVNGTAFEFDSACGYNYLVKCRVTTKAGVSNSEYITIGKNWDSTSVVEPGYIYIENCELEGANGSNTTGLAIYCGQYIFVDKCDFANLTHACDIKTNNNTYVDCVTFTNTQFFNYSGTAILINRTNTGSRVRGISFDNCEILNTTTATFIDTSASAYMIDEITLDNCIIMGDVLPNNYLINGNKALNVFGVNTIKTPKSSSLEKLYNSIHDIDDKHKKSMQNTVLKQVPANGSIDITWDLKYDWCLPTHYVPIVCGDSNNLSGITWIGNGNNSTGVYTLTITNSNPGPRYISATLA